MRRALIGVVLFALLSAGCAVSKAAQKPAEQSGASWWKQKKIIFMWGQWMMSRADKSRDTYDTTVPREVFRNIGQAGITLYADCDLRRHDGASDYARTHARYAHEFGVKYFNTMFVYYMPEIPGGRNWVQETGADHHFKCPLDESVYDKWLLAPNLPLAKECLLDGIHVDWEFYGGQGEAGICYCDDCFSRFLTAKAIKEPMPEKAKRHPYLKEHNLTADYERSYHKRRVEMFTRIRQKLQAANPDILFSSYGTVFSDFTRAMNTPRNPFIFLDARDYESDDRKPWWESYGSRLRKEGYLYIPGGWTNALFGAQPSQVNAARWIYEASINEDGCWLWFERELDDEILRGYASASRDIKAVQGRVGKYLFDGKRDPNFVTAVEWSGRPETEQAILPYTYHLGQEHLAHINNRDSDWPLRVRLRFPRLAGNGKWTVRDAMTDLYFSRDAKSAVWTTEQLRAGVVVSMEPRSDMFLLLSPVGSKPQVADSRLVLSNEFDALPTHAEASAHSGSIKAMIDLYTMKNSIWGERLDALLPSTEKVFDLPKTGWLFKMDKEDVGAGAGWYVPQSSLDGWVAITTDDFWGDKGGVGAGWYRSDVEIPTLPKDKRIYLHFGAVDEHLVLWIDGKYAGDYDRTPGDGWDKPFAVDVTGKLTAGKHHLALRAYNASAAGGVWKPISVLAGPSVPGATDTLAQTNSRPSGQLVYTASEPMGFIGAEGGLTIGSVIRSVDVGFGIGPRLRQLRGHLWSPQYSPDGSRIAFVHDAGGRGQIYVMNEDGTGAINLSNNAFCDRSPVWSPDGTRIAFISDRSGDWDIYTMNSDGSGQKRLAGNPGLDRAPAWSPDGKRVAWESHTSGMPTVWVCDADGGNSRPLISPSRPFKIEQAQTGKDNVFSFASVAWPYQDNTFYLTDPKWSPDGKRIAARCLNAYSSSSLAVVDADGSRMLQAIPYMEGMANVTWSPDGSQLAGTMRTAPQETERSGVFVVKADGSKEYRWLMDVTPLGPRIGGGQRHGLLSYYSNGSAQPRRVVKSFYSVAWSPDGRTLAFSSDIAPSGAFYVYTISPEGGQPARIELTKSAWPNQIMWRPR